MRDDDGLDSLADQAEALEYSLGAATDMAAGFNSELIKVSQTLSDTVIDVSKLEGGVSRGLRKAFDGLIFDGVKLSDALRTVARSMADAAYSSAMKPVTDHFGGLIAQGVGSLVGGLLPFADGAPFSQGRVVPFATGGVVTGPVSFPMRGGCGLMGEAGPEAIMPLTRGADGKLGVRASGGGGGAHVVMNISTPDVAGFQRSQGQIAAKLSRALSRGNRNR